MSVAGARNDAASLAALEEDAPEWIVTYGKIGTGRDIGEVRVRAYTDFEAYHEAVALLSNDLTLGIGRPRRVA